MKHTPQTFSRTVAAGPGAEGGPLTRNPHPYRLLPPRNSYIQRGVMLYSLILLIVHSLHFVTVYPSLENPGFSVMAWVFLGIATAFTALMILLRTGNVSVWSLVVSYALVILIIGYDVSGSWEENTFLEQLTAAYAVSSIILMIVASVNYHLAVITIAAYGLSILILAQLHDTQTLITQVEHSSVFLFSLCTLIIVFLIIEKYRQTLDAQLDRIHSSGSFGSPRIAFGRGFSDEIVKLDGAAEELLSRVAQGDELLPLRPEASRRAGEIAQRLRAHLVHDHRQTWLDHAVQDHERLINWVNIDDPNQLLGLMGPSDRHSLFSVVWQLVHLAKNPIGVLTIQARETVSTNADKTGEFQPETQSRETYFYHQPKDEQIFVTLQTEFKPKQFSPTIWLELDKLGNYQTELSSRITSIHLEHRLCPAKEGQHD